MKIESAMKLKSDETMQSIRKHENFDGFDCGMKRDENLSKKGFINKR